MAEAQDSLDVSELKDHFLECSVCLEHFDQAERCPRLLVNCLHSFCSQCLEQLLKEEGRGQVTCPNCRQVQKVKGNAQSLPIDPVRNKLVDYVKFKKGKQIPCTDCPDGSHAVARCHECQIYMCAPCKEAHHRNRSTRKHTCQSLKEALSEPVKNFLSHRCEDHPDYKIEFFCRQCSSLCCVSCPIVKHKGHDLDPIEDAANSMLSSLKTKMEEVEKSASVLRRKKTSLKEKSIVQKVDLKHTTTSINKTFDELIGKFNCQRNKLITELKERTESTVNSLEKQLEATEDSLAQMESTLEYFKQMESKSDDCEVLSAGPVLVKSLEAAAAVDLTEDVQHPTWTFSPGEMNNVISMVQRTGEIHSDTAVRDKDHECTASGADTLTLDRKTVTVTSEDEDQGSVGGSKMMSYGSKMGSYFYRKEKTDTGDNGWKPKKSIQADKRYAKHGNTGETQLKITLVEGDIAKTDAEVGVNVTTKSLDMDFGAISKSFKKEGGHALEKECNRYKGYQINEGSFIRTSGGDLKCKHVFHCCLPLRSDSKCDQKYKKLVKDMLKEADKFLRCKSIALPALGTGVFHSFDASWVADTLYNSVTDFEKQKLPKYLKEVKFVVYPKNKDVVKAFEDKIWRASQADEFGSSAITQESSVTFPKVTVISGELAEQQGQNNPSDRKQQRQNIQLRLNEPNHPFYGYPQMLSKKLQVSEIPQLPNQAFENIQNPQMQIPHLSGPKNMMQNSYPSGPTLQLQNPSGTNQQMQNPPYQSGPNQQMQNPGYPSGPNQQMQSPAYQSGPNQQMQNSGCPSGPNQQMQSPAYPSGPNQQIQNPGYPFGPNIHMQNSYPSGTNQQMQTPAYPSGPNQQIQNPGYPFGPNIHM